MTEVDRVPPKYGTNTPTPLRIECVIMTNTEAKDLRGSKRTESDFIMETISVPSATHLAWASIIGGITSGILDLSSAMVAFRARGIGSVRMLQGIASAALGPSAFAKGTRTAALGAAFHFVIAFSAATIYCLAALKFTILFKHPWVCGPLYGIAVHLFMTFVVLPLSKANRPFSLSAFLVQFVIHMFAVGLPIALVAHRFLR